MVATLLLAGCGDDLELRGTPSAVVGDEVLYQEVVDELSERESIDEDQARARAIETLRWVAARRAELAEHPEPPEHPDDLDPARARQLERAAMVRLWLRERFEPSHRASDIPDSLIAQNLADPNVVRRYFHPEVWVVCQVLIVPASKGANGRNEAPPSEGEPAARWQARAEQALAPFAARARRLESDLLAHSDCSLLARLAETSQREFPAAEPDPSGAPAGPEAGALTLRYEQFGFAPSTSDSLDAGWVAKVTAEPRPRLVGPFVSPFGLHLVLVAAIQPANLEDGSRPSDELQRAREAELRDQMLESWRADQLQLELRRARDDRGVRLAPELERGR
ncbi:hypothetical protein ACNOYE_36880 [Nannocystaceae bacterium ST9]